jgi:hypothetical protein
MTLIINLNPEFLYTIVQYKNDFWILDIYMILYFPQSSSYLSFGIISFLRFKKYSVLIHSSVDFLCSFIIKYSYVNFKIDSIYNKRQLLILVQVLFNIFLKIFN